MYATVDAAGVGRAVVVGGGIAGLLAARVLAERYLDVRVLQTFADSLTFPDIGRAIRTGEALDDPARIRFPASVRRRYERLHRFPEGLLPIGDAVRSLNPIYGQGTTVAALQALALRDQMRLTVPTDPRRWPRRLAQIVDAPWDMVAGADLAIPGVQGPRTLQMRVLGTYIARLHEAAERDPQLALAFTRVMALIDPPTSLLRPGTTIRVLLGRERQRRLRRNKRLEPSAGFGDGRSRQAQHEEVQR